MAAKRESEIRKPGLTRLGIHVQRKRAISGNVSPVSGFHSDATIQIVATTFATAIAAQVQRSTRIDSFAFISLPDELNLSDRSDSAIAKKIVKNARICRRSAMVMT